MAQGTIAVATGGAALLLDKNECMAKGMDRKKEAKKPKMDKPKKDKNRPYK